MSEENISQEFKLKNIDETRNGFTKEINWDELVSNKHKSVFRILNYIEHLFFSVSTFSGCDSIFAFAGLVDIPIEIASSAIGLKICVIIAGIKKSKSIIKKKKKKHDQLVLLAKSKLNSIEVVLFKALIDSNISYDHFF